MYRRLLQHRAQSDTADSSGLLQALRWRQARSRGLLQLKQTLCTRQDKASVEQLGAGAEASCSFPPLEAALFRPWKGLHPRRTHRLFFTLSSA